MSAPAPARTPRDASKRSSRRLPPPSEEVLRIVADGRAESWDAPKLLSWAVENFHPRLALSCSFGAPEGLVLLDMLHRIEPASRVFVLDTGRLPQATHDLIDRVRQRYEKSIEVLAPSAEAVSGMVGAHGVNLFYESVEKRQLCCGVRKVQPLARYLGELDAWVTGLRREQNITRRDTRKLLLDHTHGGIVKLNPIADWGRAQVLEYVAAHKVPTNALHAKGYPSVGCEPCSRAIQPGEDERAGRWWWEHPESRECGIHVGQEGEGSGI